MQDTGKDDAPRRDYGLFVRRDDGSFLKLSDEGVALAGERLVWRRGDGEDARRLDAVSGVNLRVTHVSEHGDFGKCEIRFDDASLLLVTGSGAFGLPDDGRKPVYAAFVRDLHRALAARPAGSVRFFAGVSEERLQGMRVMLVIIGLLLIALPLLLLILTGEPGLLVATLFGAIVVAGGYAWLQKNRPRSYDPRRVPLELLP